MLEGIVYALRRLVGQGEETHPGTVGLFLGVLTGLSNSFGIINLTNADTYGESETRVVASADLRNSLSCAGED